MTIPGQIKSFLSSPDVLKRRIELMRRFSVALDVNIKITKIINRLLNKEIQLGGLAAAFQETGLPAETIKQIILDMAGYELLPISDYLGDVSSFIRSLGGNPDEYPKQRITIREVTPASLVTEFLHEHPVNVPAFLEHRLREILESRVREVRKDPETITRLTRAEKIGGVELPQAEAESLVEALAAKIAGVKIAPDNAPIVAPAVLVPAETSDAAGSADNEAAPSEAELTEQTEQDAGQNSAQAIPVTKPAPSASAISKAGNGFTPEDEREAEAIRTKVLPRVVTESLFDQGEEIKKGTEAVFSIYGLTLPENLKERFKTIIASHLKGIRDQAETEDLLVRTSAVGGMGFGIDSADRILRAIEDQNRAINGKRDEAMKNEKEVFVKQSIEATFAKDESRKRGELEELDRMYSSLTGKVSKMPAPAAVANPVPTPPPTPRPAPASAATIVKNQEPRTLYHSSTTSIGQANFQPQTPAAQIPAPVPPPVYKPQPAAPITPKPPAPPMLPPPAAPLLPPPPAVRMQDVRPVAAAAARLTGPAEELKNMTLVDFRRLSADPAEACRKIVDKLDLLEEHAYAKRIEGVKAWQQSEVNKLYLQVIMAAFSGGKPIADAIADNQAANRETLTEREVHAIMELNKHLKA